MIAVMVNRVLSDIEIHSVIANAYKNSGLEWGIVGVHDKMGGDGSRSSAVTPTVQCVQS